jgi:hypothetical protein
LWLPVGAAAFAAVVGLGTLLSGGEPEPVGTDRGPVPTDSTGRDGDLSFTVLTAECGFESVISRRTVTAEGQFCLAELRVNAGGSGRPQRLDLECQLLIAGDRGRYAADEEGTHEGSDRSPFETGIVPGTSIEVQLTFDVPEDERAVGLELHSACGSPGARLAFVGTESPATSPEA